MMRMFVCKSVTLSVSVLIHLALCDIVDISIYIATNYLFVATVFGFLLAFKLTASSYGYMLSVIQ